MRKLLFVLIFILACAVYVSAQTTGPATSLASTTTAQGDQTNDFNLYILERAPGAATVALAGAGAGNTTNGTHQVKVVFTTATSGHTNGGTASAAVTVVDNAVNGKIAISSIPTGPAFVSGRKIYLTKAGGTTYYLLSNGTIADNTTTTLTANDSDTTLNGAAVLPTNNTTLNPIIQYDGPTGVVTVGGATVGTITGSGTANTLPKFTAATTIGNSAVTDNATTFAIATNKFTVTEASGNTFFAGVLSGGSGPTTITDAAGKILSAALNTVAVAQGGTGTGSTLVGLVRGNASAMTAAEISGDATTSGSNVLTLASVISAGGPTGSATVAPIITYDAKGRLTTVSSATITPPISAVTGLGTGVAAAAAVSVGSVGAFVVNGGAGGTPSSLVCTNCTGTASGLTAGAVTGFTAGAGVLTGPASAGVAETLSNNETITGIKTFSPTARSSGTAAYYTINVPTDTGQTASTESIGVNFVTATRTWADGTVALQRERFFAGVTYNKTTTSTTFTDIFNTSYTQPVAGSGVTFTRPHTVGILDSTSASSSITGGLIIATTYGTTATSVGIGGGNIYAGGTVTATTVTDPNSRYIGNATGITLDGNGSYAYAFASSGGAVGTRDTFISTGGIANVRLGAAAAASPVAQTLSTQGSRSGTDTNVAGGNLTIQPGTGTGNSTGSSLIFNTPVAVASGTGAQTQTATLTLQGGNTTVGGTLFSTTILNGHTAALGRLGESLEVTTSANFGGGAFNTFSTTAGQASILDFNRSKSATKGTQTIVASGDALGNVVFNGSDGTQFLDAAFIKGVVDGTPGTNDMPGRLEFYTTLDGASTGTLRMKIDNAGHIFMPNISTAAGATGADACFQGSGATQEITTDTALCIVSARRFKNTIQSDHDGLAFIRQLRPVHYFLNEAPERGRQYGFVAEEVEKVNKDFVTYQKDGQIRSVLYIEIISKLTAAVQEQQEEITTRDVKMASLALRVRDTEQMFKEQQAQIQALRKEVDVLKAKPQGNE